MTLILPGKRLLSSRSKKRATDLVAYINTKSAQSTNQVYINFPSGSSMPGYYYLIVLVYYGTSTTFSNIPSDWISVSSEIAAMGNNARTLMWIAPHGASLPSPYISPGRSIQYSITAFCFNGFISMGTISSVTNFSGATITVPAYTMDSKGFYIMKMIPNTAGHAQHFTNSTTPNNSLNTYLQIGSQASAYCPIYGGTLSPGTYGSYSLTRNPNSGSSSFFQWSLNSV